MNENSIYKTVFIDRVTRALAMQKSITLSHPRQTRMPLQTNSETDVSTSSYNKHAISNLPNVDERKYTADHKKQHIGAGPSIEFVIYWNELAPKNDIIEPPEHILQYFIARLWLRMQRQ